MVPFPVGSPGAPRGRPRFRRPWRVFAVLTTTVVLWGTSVARADLIPGFAVLSNTEADIDVGFDNGVLQLGIFDEFADVEFAADEALLFVGPAARTTQPASPAFNFIGAGAGNPVWIIPQAFNSQVLFLGLDTGELPPGTIDSGVLALRAVRGPGQFSAWQTDAFGNPTFFISTFEGGITAADAIPLPDASDAHFNYGFTATGLYEIDFQAVALTPGGATITSEVTTFHFGVEEIPVAVPEPASSTLLALGAGTLLLWARRRRG